MILTAWDKMTDPPTDLGSVEAREGLLLDGGPDYLRGYVETLMRDRHCTPEQAMQVLDGRSNGYVTYALEQPQAAPESWRKGKKPSWQK